MAHGTVLYKLRICGFPLTETLWLTAQQYMSNNCLIIYDLNILGKRSLGSEPGGRGVCSSVSLQWMMWLVFSADPIARESKHLQLQNQNSTCFYGQTPKADVYSSSKSDFTRLPACIRNGHHVSSQLPLLQYYIAETDGCLWLQS